MTDREKPIELICDSVHRMRLDYPEAADYLIANGVVVREKGEWVWSEENECWVCSKCELSALNNYRGNSTESNICPNCGADMRKGENG